jgi:hypothetical protein
MPRGELPSQVTKYHANFGPRSESSRAHHGGAGGGGLPGADRSAERGSGGLFPSADALRNLGRLAVPTADNTDLKPMSPKDIRDISRLNPQRFIPSGGTAWEEIVKLKVAANLPGANIEIVDSNIAKSEERGALQQLVKEFLGSEPTKAIFRTYLKEMAADTDVLRKEYREYLLGHKVTGAIEDPTRTHYIENLGLNRDGQAETDALRGQMVDFVRETLQTSKLDEVGGQFSDLITESPHDNLSPEDTAVVLGLGFVSNFVRGGDFYGYRGRHSDYPPRARA